MKKQFTGTHKTCLECKKTKYRNAFRSGERTCRKCLGLTMAIDCKDAPLWNAIKRCDRAKKQKNCPPKIIEMLEKRVREEAKKVSDILLKGKPPGTTVKDVLESIASRKPL